MEIHKPKAAHSVREFLIEIGTIVCGILIALGLEQAVERIHWATEVRQAHAALRPEMNEANDAFVYRVAAASCISRRLDSLESIIEKAARKEPTPHIGEVLPDIGFGIADSNWENYRASQVLTHFEEGESAKFGEYYFQIKDVQGFIFKEDDEIATLNVLSGDPGRLGAADFANLRVAVQRLRKLNALITLISRQELDLSKALGVPAPLVDMKRLKLVCQPLALASPT